MGETAVHYSMSGFSQASGVRLFAFEAVSRKRARARYTVGVDLALAQRHGVPLQELPRLCCAMLGRMVLADAAETSIETQALSLTEDDLKQYSADCAAAREKAAARRKPHVKRPGPSTLGQAWRGPAH